MYKVSILVPIYGVEQYIERCSRSLFEQTYQNLEYVFVNDCSPDGSVAVLNEVIADYPNRKDDIVIVDHKLNRGLAAARNTGLDNSSGSFVICVDSDDWLEPNAIELLVNGQSENNADIVTGGYLVHNDEAEPDMLKGRYYKDKEQMVLQMMQRTWDHFVAGRLVRRSLFVDNEVQWEEGLDVAEDRYIMSILAYYSLESVSIDEVIYHYERRNCHALTKSSDGKSLLRNNNQELRNLLLLERFFRDKETVYQKECSRCVMDQLVNNWKTALSFSDKTEYYDIVRMIDNRPDAELEQFRWEKKGVKGWIIHHYYIMKNYQRYSKFFCR